MITIETPTYNGSTYHKIVKWSNRFNKEYDGTTYDNNSKRHIRKSIDLDQYKFINSNGKTVGFINMDVMGSTGPDFRSINCMYVHPDYRGQGVASLARKLLLGESSNCPVIATVVTAKRLSERPDYWLEQGFCYYTIAPHNKFDPGVTIDNAENVDNILLQLFTVIPEGDVPKSMFKSIKETVKQLEETQ